MKNFRRTYILTALALCALMVGATTADAYSNKTAVKKGATWIRKSRISNFPGTGFQADTISALVAARRAGANVKPSAWKRFVDEIKADTPNYAQSSGPAGKLILAVVASSNDPRCFGPVGERSNLVAIVMSDYNSKSGQFGQTVYDHALAILGLKAAHEHIPSKAVSFAKQRRGKYGWNFAMSAKSGDEVESTAIMIEAMRAAGVSKKNAGLKAAYKWMSYQRNVDGGYNPDALDGGGETQSDTTAYAIRAADAMGHTGGVTKKSKNALRALQMRTGLIRSTPTVKGDFPGISTANGVLALSGQHYPVVVRKKRSTCTV